MAIPYNVIAFAGNENKTYEKFRDYYFQFSDEVMARKLAVMMHPFLSLRRKQR